ncbi:MAG: MobV family relaxase [Prevotella sp.]
MEQKASVHMQPLKSMAAAQGNENERRGWDRNSYERTVDYSGKPCYYDWFRRHLNFEVVKGKICPMLSQETPLKERLEKRLQELGFKHYKKDAPNAPNICMDFVVGGNRQRMREMAFGEQAVIFGGNDERNASVNRCREIENWALDTYRWIAHKYGEENIIGFNVHLDETTPHAHVQVVPVSLVKKRGRVKAGEERGTKLAVNYYGVVGQSPKECSAYYYGLHTDYHIQVGYKYGLERGTFFEDLTPEEQALRKHRTGAEFALYNETMKKVKAAKKELGDLEAQVKQAETKLKGLMTMIANLEKQRESLEIDISYLEDMVKNGEGDVEKNTRRLEELKEQVSVINSKILDKQQKLSAAEQELRDLDGKHRQLIAQNEELSRSNRVMVDDTIRRHDAANAALTAKRAELAKMDKAGELRMAERHIEERDALIFRRWPEAREAVAAIFDFGNSNIAKDFTLKQALDVEKAIASAGIERTDAAKDLLTLAGKDFDRCRTPKAWVDMAAREVMNIARGTHLRLNALLRSQPKDAGGGPSYITDLTDWAGNQVKM